MNVAGISTVLSLAILAAGCTVEPDQPDLPLEGMWVMTKVTYDGIKKKSPGEPVLVIGSNGALALDCDCNRCFAGYSVNGDTLHVEDNMYSTLKGCGSAVFGGLAVRVLGQENVLWRTDGDRLTIGNPDFTNVLTAVSSPVPSAP